MSSAAQVLANQANAQLSTGPVSFDGKARSAQNARRHGLTARHLNITFEDRAEFTELEAALRLRTRPADCFEEEIFHRILTHTWNLRRIETFESLILAETNPLAESDPYAAKLERYARYRRDLERGLYRAMKELSKLQTERVALLQQHAAVVQGITEGAPLAEITRLTKNTGDFFNVDNYSEARLVQARLTKGIDHVIEINQDALAEFETHEAEQNEADLAAAEDGMPILRYMESRQ
ncbi:hypothetical protein [Paludibaculum fermentans]|uniref:Uncharacterized protein n=1 Tax=Paludibaculum fermentans TaxID=1473598 RepID=A0A7S7SJE6_PALFE|nr:hypothetical protein [Paludibaculum fermentans]QOY87997.1 hypothetical protein IRI77_35560 [Paludibaculum fermentans]